MRVVSVLDTAITSYNLGNQIIMNAVYDFIDEKFGGDFIYSLPWEGPMSKTSLRYMKESDFVFFGGTNSLSSDFLRYKQMGFRVRDLVSFNNLSLLGVGWWQYQDRPDFYTRLFLKRLLGQRVAHSVRDEYTKQMLNDIGVSNVMNTSCPTTWKLTEEHCLSIPRKKARNVVLTLTDYSRVPSIDEQLINILSESYDKIYCWIQGAGDLAYIRSFGEQMNRMTLVSPKLSRYDQLLDSEDCDYIGTRLHAGIRAIQKKKRALVLAVDNRAIEISKDINLNVVPRDDFSAIRNFIAGYYRTVLKVPFEEIRRWKAQFEL